MKIFGRSDEVRAGRRRWLLLPPLALLLLAFGLLARPHSPAPSNTAKSNPALGIDPADTAESDEAFETVTDAVRRGDTFSGLLLRNRLSMQEIARVLEITRRLDLFSPRALQPGQTLSLERDEYGALRRMVFSLSPEETYIYEAHDDSLVAYQQPVAREVRLRKFEGRIEDSVDDAIRDAGGDYRLTLKFADVFAYDIDFLTEVRTGDRFSLLVEERFADGQFLGYGEILYGRYEGEHAGGTAIWYKGADAHGGYYDAKGQALKKSFLRAPLNYRRISSFFSRSRFHPILRIWRPHEGIDYAAAEGTPVVAVASGSVTTAGWKGGYGRCVEIRHTGGTVTRYGHMSRLATGLHAGSHVEQGQLVGYVGHTGLATGPHLHYEIMQNGVRINPLTLKNLPAPPIPGAEMPQFSEYVADLGTLDQTLLAGQVVERFDSTRISTALALLQSGSDSLALR